MNPARGTGAGFFVPGYNAGRGAAPGARIPAHRFERKGAALGAAYLTLKT